MRRRQFVQWALAAPFATQFTTVRAGPSPADSAPGMDPVRDYLSRMREPDQRYPGDICADAPMRATLETLHARLERAEQHVGYAHFSVISLDALRQYGRHVSDIGALSAAELALIEALFYADASRYGFLGQKPLVQLTQAIDPRAIVKVPGSGHYLYAGRPRQLFEEISRALGGQVILSSGVRGIVKQLRLFVAKALRHDGNLSLASRSLAPPGYSFHGTGDFDVGIPGWGERNFTADFADTAVFQRLIDLGYVSIRYPLDNRLGVRFEPWHIRVA